MAQLTGKFVSKNFPQILSKKQILKAQALLNFPFSTILERHKFHFRQQAARQLAACQFNYQHQLKPTPRTITLNSNNLEHTPNRFVIFQLVSQQWINSTTFSISCVT
jgi:hypothetical protein